MGRDAGRLRHVVRYFTLFAGLGGLFVAGALLHPQFLTIANQRDVLGQVSINGILAVGMTLVILTAGIDLSVGSVMSLSRSRPRLTTTFFAVPARALIGQM